MTLKFEHKKCFVFIISILLITNLTILLDIPFLRQILGFLFLTVLPGLLILRILKLNKLHTIEIILYSVGLSIAFVMFFGLLLNNITQARLFDPIINYLSFIYLQIKEKRDFNLSIPSISFHNTYPTYT